MNPLAYKLAITKTASLIKESSVIVDYFNVGGGFPSKYPGMEPKPLSKYFKVIDTEFSKYFGKNSDVNLLSEPGRALVSNSMSLIVRVDLRKKIIYTLMMELWLHARCGSNWFYLPSKKV